MAHGCLLARRDVAFRDKADLARKCAMSPNDPKADFAQRQPDHFQRTGLTRYDAAFIAGTAAAANTC
jgi:hypothetical protein